jgi:BASS family bile acid:Na+ symporter
MSLEGLINLLVTITLIEMMVLIGLQVPFTALVDTVRDWRLIAGAVVANYLLVPALAVVLLVASDASPMVAAGILVLAVCPGAPFGPPLVGMARGEVAQAVGLMALLAGSSAIVSPLLLQVLLPWVAGSETLRIDAAGIVVALLTTQLLPLLFGLLVRNWGPQLADRLANPFALVS